MADRQQDSDRTQKSGQRQGGNLPETERQGSSRSNPERQEGNRSGSERQGGSRQGSERQVSRQGSTERGQQSRTAGTDRDFDQGDESINQGHGHPREERGMPE